MVQAVMPQSQNVCTWDGEEPWLGHGPRIPNVNLLDVLAVIDRVNDLCGPEGNPRALPIVDFLLSVSRLRCCW